MRSMESTLDDMQVWFMHFLVILKSNFKQEKIWELEKSWENNLVFYGITIMKNEEDKPQLIESRVKEILKTNLYISRHIPILRVKRAHTGSNIRGSKPVTVYFRKYEDKADILR